MKRLLLICLLTSIIFGASAQNSRPIMLGFSPAITLDNNYPQGAFDINVFPIAIQYPNIIDNLDIRFLGFVNYGFRPYGSALISVGGEICLPYHFDFSRNKDFISQGFYIGPGAAFRRNIHYNHSSFSIFVEPGYHFLFNEKFSLIIGPQYKLTRINNDSGANTTQSNFGLKVILGWWIGR